MSELKEKEEKEERDKTRHHIHFLKLILTSIVSGCPQLVIYKTVGMKGDEEIFSLSPELLVRFRLSARYDGSIGSFFSLVAW